MGGGFLEVNWFSKLIFQCVMMLFAVWKLLYIFDLLVRIKPCLGSATKTAFLVILYITTKCCCCQNTIHGSGASSFSLSKFTFIPNDQKPVFSAASAMFRVEPSRVV